MRIPVDVGVYQVSDLGVQGKLYVLVKVEVCVAPLRFVHRWIVGEVVYYLQCKVCASAGRYLHLGNFFQAFQLAAYFVEAGYLAQQTLLTACVSAVLIQLCPPKIIHQLLHAVVLILLERHVLPADDNITHLRHFHIAVVGGVILHRRCHVRRIVEI